MNRVRCFFLVRYILLLSCDHVFQPKPFCNMIVRLKRGRKECNKMYDAISGFNMMRCGACPLWRSVPEHFTVTFDQWWIRRREPVACSSQHPDLSSLKFSLGGGLNCCEMDLVQKDLCKSGIVVAVANIYETPGVPDRVSQSVVLRCNTCIENNFGKFNISYKFILKQNSEVKSSTTSVVSCVFLCNSQ